MDSQARMGQELQQAADFRDQLSTAYEAWRNAYQGQLEAAIRVGDMLLQAKEQLTHGEWRPWLEANFPGSYRTAAVAMQLAGAYHRDASALAGGTDDQMPQSIKAALATIQKPRTKPDSTAVLDALGDDEPEVVEAEIVAESVETDLTAMAAAYRDGLVRLAGDAIQSVRGRDREAAEIFQQAAETVQRAINLLGMA